MIVRTITDKLIDLFLYGLHSFFVRLPVGIAVVIADGIENDADWVINLEVGISSFCDRIGRNVLRGLDFTFEKLPKILSKWYRTKIIFFTIRNEKYS